MTEDKAKKQLQRRLPAEVVANPDRPWGSLTWGQLFCLLPPLFLAVVLLISPPQLRLAGYQVVLVVLAVFLASLLASRIRGRLVVVWLVVLARFYQRNGYLMTRKQPANKIRRF